MILLLGQCGYERVAAPLRALTGVEVVVAGWSQVELVERLEPELVCVDLYEHRVVMPWLRGGRGDLSGPRAVVQALAGRSPIYRGLRRPMAGTWGLLGAGPDLSELEAVVEGQPVLDVQGLWARHGLPTDDVEFGSGHGEAGVAGAELEARWIHALWVARTSGAKKVLVCDLDDTLIHGLLVAEDFAEKNPAWGSGDTEQAWWRLKRGLHEAVRQVASRGVVLALCSRNDPGLLRERFRRRADASGPLELALDLDDFTLVEGGFGPKSGALRRIAERLGVGLDSLVFMDDSPFENAEVQAHAPEVALLPRPWRESLLLGPLFTTWGPRIDRRPSYASRAAVTRPALDLERFLVGMDLRIQVREAVEGDLPRVRQLLRRVQQLDLTGERPELPDAGGVMVGFVRDRLADHGLVCAGVFRQGRLQAWVCSCRVLPHRVAPSLLWAMRQRHPDALVQRVSTGRNGATSGLIEESERGLPCWVASG